MAESKQKSILVLYGGKSRENEVSLASGRSCADALERLGHRVSLFNPGQNDVKSLVERLEQEKPDLVFNALHGTFGEDGTIQGLLELMGVAYTHSGIAASAIAIDKLLTKVFLSAHGIPFAHSVEVSTLNRTHPLPPPYVLKPVCEGSSIGVYIFQEGDAPPEEGLYEKPPRLMAEQFISGRELTVGILNGKAMGVTELRPKQGFYDYDAKYKEGMTEHLCPAPISGELEKAVRDMSEQAFALIGCRGVARCDFRHDATSDEVFMLEINTQPGMTDLSLVPEQGLLLDMSFDDLVRSLIEGDGR